MTYCSTNYLLDGVLRHDSWGKAIPDSPYRYYHDLYLYGEH